MKMENAKSYFDRAEIGSICKGGFKLISKDKISFHKCPLCKSTDTFHKRREKELGNCFASALEDESSPFSMTYKQDICMSCGYMWIFELYMYEEVEE